MPATSHNINKFLRRVGNKWCVFSKKGKQLVCRDTKEEAEQDLKRIESFSRKNDMDSFKFAKNTASKESWQITITTTSNEAWLAIREVLEEKKLESIVKVSVTAESERGVEIPKDAGPQVVKNSKITKEELETTLAICNEQTGKPSDIESLVVWAKEIGIEKCLETLTASPLLEDPGRVCRWITNRSKE
jgi:hypothetical protein